MVQFILLFLRSNLYGYFIFVKGDDYMSNESNFNELMLKYNFALSLIETQLNILIKEYEFKNKTNPVEHIKSRIKSEKSATEKLHKKGYDVNLDNLKKYVHDMIGIRIVCSFISDVDIIVDLIKNSKQFKILDEKNYIDSPKDTGYMSYHLIIEIPLYLDEKVEYIPAEIQIRTVAMDFFASLDHKISYKFPGNIPDEVKIEMISCLQVIQSLDKKMYELNEIVRKYNDL